MKYLFAKRTEGPLKLRTTILLPDYYLWLMMLKLIEVEKFAQSCREYWYNYTHMYSQIVKFFGKTVMV